MQYYCAGSGQSAFGRERETATGYSQAADTAEEGTLALSLLTRRDRHKLLEELANDGFMERSWEELQANLTDLDLWMAAEDWHPHSQVQIAKRTCK